MEALGQQSPALWLTHIHPWQVSFRQPPTPTPTPPPANTKADVSPWLPQPRTDITPFWRVFHRVLQSDAPSFRNRERCKLELIKQGRVSRCVQMLTSWLIPYWMGTKFFTHKTFGLAHSTRKYFRWLGCTLSEVQIVDSVPALKYLGRNRRIVKCPLLQVTATEDHGWNLVDLGLAKLALQKMLVSRRN